MVDIDSSKEVWKDIGIQNDYQVSNLGRISRIKGKKPHIFKKRRIIKQNKNRGGYLQVTLFGKNKEITHCRVHRLVALAFIPKPDDKSHINHKDTIKINNYVDNLEWCTKRENEKHAQENRLYSSGEKHCKAKLTWKKVKEIRARYIPNKYGQYKLARDYRMSRSAIQKVLNGKSWRIQCK